jgi:NADH dehydrogenase [ubiquinone] 1 alpha subcomplex assembly factor 6
VLTALWDTLYGGSSSGSNGSSSSKSSSRASIYQLKRMLDAREQDLVAPAPPLTLTDLESYAENTASQLLYLQLGAAGER